MDDVTRNRFVALERRVEELENSVKFFVQAEADRQGAAKPAAPASGSASSSGPAAERR